MSTRYFCGTDKRRDDVRKTAGLNGIDFVEVDDTQTKITVAFLKTDGVAALGVANFRVAGGERITGVRVVAPVTAGGANLTVRVDRRGDFSRYALLLRRDPTSPDPPAGFDPQLASAGFSFKAACDSAFDCLSAPACPPEAPDEPDIDYLAKDYASFRQLMLDRLTRTAPGWTERNPADLGVTLVEILAYVGDQLSYWQDAVATEAYLATARSRISVRRHARLVDYRMHDGCCARAWVQIRVGANGVVVPSATPLWTRVGRLPARAAPNSADADKLAALAPAEAASFETVRGATLHLPHNLMRFYDWGEADCCLPRGATGATLRDGRTAGARLRLDPGDVLLLAETEPGGTDDAPALAGGQAVRLVGVRPRPGDPPLLDPVSQVPIVEIEWHPDDALTAPIRLTGPAGRAGVALGNLVLARHAKEVTESFTCDRASRYRPKLSAGPLTQSAPDPLAGASAPAPVSAADAMRWDLAAVRPQIRLEQSGHVWEARTDLLSSGPEDRVFVVETEGDGAAQLRFGDGAQGRRPAPKDAFVARYRVGNGTAGNIGADALFHILSPDPAVLGVRNPLPAEGGVEPESSAAVRVRAPAAFRVQERAVTAEDYAAAAERAPQVKRAAATLRWTGSWFTAFVTVEPRRGRVDAALKGTLRNHLERYRLAGHDLEIDGPRYVAIELELEVRVRPDYFRARVRTGLLEALGSRLHGSGQKSLFHPDLWTFGQTVYLSQIVTAALSVAGVAGVNVTTFRRQRRPDPAPLRDGLLAIDRLEIAQLANDPNYPERGVLRLNLMGGK